MTYFAFAVMSLIITVGLVMLVRFWRGDSRPAGYADPNAPMIARNLYISLLPGTAAVIFLFFFAIVGRIVNLGEGVAIWIVAAVLYFLFGSTIYLTYKPAPNFLKPAWLKAEEAAARR